MGHHFYQAIIKRNPTTRAVPLHHDHNNYMNDDDDDDSIATTSKQTGNSCAIYNHRTVSQRNANRQSHVMLGFGIRIPKQGNIDIGRVTR